MNLSLIKTRAAVVKSIRRFFDERGFLEMHTPRLIGLPGQEPHLEPLWTEVHTEKIKNQNSKIKNFSAALITSPEYAMKKLLAAGFDKIYDLGPCFRDCEPWDGTHDPEFLMLEWYRREAGLEELMQDTEELVKFVAPTIVPAQPFRRLTVRDAMLQYANVDIDPLLENRTALADVVRAHGYTVQADDTWDDLFFKIFLTEVEPKLGFRPPDKGVGGFSLQPTFLYRYPACMAALSRRDPIDPRYALRTELYIGDFELANGFAELADSEEQRARFLEDQALRRSLGKKTWPLDEKFLAALPNMGNAAGIAFGVERLVMLLTGTKSISDLLPIPVGERF